jgi:hypothetical protein
MAKKKASKKKVTKKVAKKTAVKRMDPADMHSLSEPSPDNPNYTRGGKWIG